MPEPKQRANAARSRERSGVEHVFADQKHRMGLFVRSIGITRARTRIGLANIACNMRRLLFWETAASQAWPRGPKRRDFRTPNTHPRRPVPPTIRTPPARPKPNCPKMEVSKCARLVCLDKINHCQKSPCSL